MKDASSGDLSTRNQGIVWLQLVYLVFVAALSISRHVFPSPDLILVTVVAALIWRAKSRAILFDLVPFLLLFISYQALRNFADDFSPNSINVDNLIQWERALFMGVIPARVLQANLTGQMFTPVLNVIANGFYMAHFVAPFMLAIALWHRNRLEYWWFVLGLMVLSYSRFVHFYGGFPELTANSV